MYTSRRILWMRYYLGLSCTQASQIACARSRLKPCSIPLRWNGGESLLWGICSPFQFPQIACRLSEIEEPGTLAGRWTWMIREPSDTSCTTIYALLQMAATSARKYEERRDGTLHEDSFWLGRRLVVPVYFVSQIGCPRRNCHI